MSLLTKEQLKQLAEAHEAFQRPIEEGTERLYDVAHELSAAVGDLTAIIDDLQARAPKQYTELELFKSLAFEILRSDDYNHILDHVDKRMAKYENTNANRQ